MSAQELRLAEDRAILDALAAQRRIGLDIRSDGELRRGSWLTDMADAVEGFVPGGVELEWKGPGGAVERTTAQVAGAKLRKLRKLTGHELPFLQHNAAGPFKITLPAPSNFILSSYKTGVTDVYYPSRAELLNDLVEIVRDEVAWLVAEGVTYIQLDAPYYSHYLDFKQRKRAMGAGLDPDREFETAIAADNRVIDGVLGKDGVSRGDVTFALHVCRGNSRSRWYTEGGYDAIAEKLFCGLNADTFLLEYDSERAGGFEPLRLAPAGKTIVLGLITTKTPQLESQQDLLRRISEASRYAPIENLALSPQCGFASVAQGNLLSLDDQWRKLELVVETARKVWGSS